MSKLIVIIFILAQLFQDNIVNINICNHGNTSIIETWSERLESGK